MWILWWWMRGENLQTSLVEVVQQNAFDLRAGQVNSARAGVEKRNEE